MKCDMSYFVLQNLGMIVLPFAVQLNTWYDRTKNEFSSNEIVEFNPKSLIF